MGSSAVATSTSRQYTPASRGRGPERLLGAVRPHRIGAGRSVPTRWWHFVVDGDPLPDPHPPAPPPSSSSAAREEVGRLLAAWRAGQPGAREDLFVLLYPQLRRLAAHILSGRDDEITLQATELVHEAYLKLLDQRQASADSHAHFFALAGRLLRRILIDRIRRRRGLKRNPGTAAVSLEVAATAATAEPPGVDLLALDQALGRLAEVDAEAAEVVELRFFAGLDLEETAAVLGVGRTTVVRRWRYARAWLHQELSVE